MNGFLVNTQIVVVLLWSNAADQTLQLSPLRDGLSLELYAVFLLYGIDSLFATK